MWETTIIVLLLSLILTFSTAAFKSARASEKGNSKQIALIENIDIDAQLFTAVKNRSIIELKALLDKGADVNARSKTGRTVLMYAIIYDAVDIVNALLDKGADVNAENNYGWTALITAAWKGNNTIVQSLLGKGAKINKKSNDGLTALLAALKLGHREVVKSLLDNGADVNIKDKANQTALMYAIINNHNHNMDDIVTILLDKGANVNAEDNKGWTALMTATWKGNKTISDALLKKNADVTKSNKYGDTALMIALKKGHKDIKEALQGKGADIGAQNKYDWISHSRFAKKIKYIITEQLGVAEEEVIPAASFIEDLGADSLDTVELIMALEEAFDLEIPDEDAEKISTVKDMIKYLEAHAQ